ncbi:hypothetical protein [Roseiconus lacunae]|uniref:hypothetical protein n=1 Tax=Roseiconus lacunae TaxID=2605694 RepID=UPI001E56BEAA|nr:hypothetical protein [Roseiconus lacunae]MCD0462573.1 hypothetical protein [Roseiconus lacunae]
MSLTPFRPLAPRPLLICIAAFVCLSGSAGLFSTVCFAQTDAQDGGQGDSRPSMPATDDEKPRPQGTSVTIAPSIVQRASGNRWTPLSVVGVNRTDEEKTETVSVYIDGDPEVQFSSKFWLPAKSRRKTWLPVLIPPQQDPERVNIPLTTMSLEEGPDGESLRPDWTDSAIVERSLLLTEMEINTGVISDAAEIDFTGRQVDRLQALMSFINVGRSTAIQQSMELPNIAFAANLLPDTHGGLDQLDQIVIAGNSLSNDTAGVGTIRRWLRRGGRLWIMLDRTDSGIVRELLGDDAVYDIADATQLNQFKLETSDVVYSSNFTSESWESERPVDFVRVFTESDDISCQIDGWPAAFWQPVGDGEVLFTTLGIEGWMLPEGRASIGLGQISRRLFEPRAKPIDSVTAMVPVVNDQIGYQIPSRGIAALLMVSNTILIALGGLWWMRQQRLERLALLVPVVAIISSAAMLWIGKMNSGSIPTTIASAQLVVLNDATNEADIQSTFAVYCQEEIPIELSSAPNTFVQPLDWSGNRTKRAQWLDNGSSRWIQPDQPPGTVENWFSDSTAFVRSTENGSDSASLVHPLVGTFDEAGFLGSFPNSATATIEDPFLASFPAANTAATSSVNDDRIEVRIRAEDSLTDGQFVSATLMDDTQSKRQEVLRELFADAEQSFLANGTQLLYWTDPTDIGLGISESFIRTGTALVSVPVKIVPPQSGARIRIPSTFIEIDSFAKYRGISALFNPRSGKWLTDVTKSTETDLLFRFPTAIGQVDLERVNVTLRISAPERLVTIKAIHGDQSTTVFEENSPTGTVRFTIDDPSVLETDQHGGLVLTVSVGAPTDPGDDSSIAPSPQQSRRATPGSESPNSQDFPEGLAPIILESDNTNKTWQIDQLTIDAEGVVR